MTRIELMRHLDISNFELPEKEDLIKWLDECDSLRYFESPKKTYRAIGLPTVMYDASGREYSELPVVSNSIILAKEKGGYIADIQKCTITLSQDSYVYTGYACLPAVTVTSGNPVQSETITI